MKEKEIEKLLKLLKEENCYVRTYTHSPTYDEIIRIIESFGVGWVKLRNGLVKILDRRNCIEPV